jgi:hypothetical protein
LVILECRFNTATGVRIEPGLSNAYECAFVSQMDLSNTCTSRNSSDSIVCYSVHVTMLLSTIKSSSRPAVQARARHLNFMNRTSKTGG